MNREDQAEMLRSARRVADACENSNELSADHLRVAEDLRALSVKRYEYERLNADLFGERMRAARHHEVLCLVLKEYVRADWSNARGDSDAKEHVAWAKTWADLAYPPPKDEP